MLITSALFYVGGDYLFKCSTYLKNIFMPILKLKGTCPGTFFPKECKTEINLFFDMKLVNGLSLPFIIGELLSES